MKIERLKLLFLVFYFLCSSTVQADLKVGVMFFDPPLVMSPIQGFHIDLANKICQGLNEKCTILPMEWNQLFIALNKGEIDLQMGVYITPQRAEKYLFSVPYMPSKGRFIVLTANKIKDVKQLKGHQLGTLREETNAGIFLGYLRANYPNFFTILEFNGIGNLLTALVNKSVDVAMVHSTAVNYWVANTSGMFSPLGPAFHLGGGYSIMALPNRQALIDNINKQINRIKANGDFAKIYTTYFGDEDSNI